MDYSSLFFGWVIGMIVGVFFHQKIVELAKKGFEKMNDQTIKKEVQNG